MRDFVHVDDVVAALLLAPGSGGVFNVGSGVATSVLELHERCRAVSGDTRQPRIAPAREGDLQKQRARHLARPVRAGLASRGRPRRRVYAGRGTGSDPGPDALPRGRGKGTERRLRPRGDRRQQGVGSPVGVVRTVSADPVRPARLRALSGRDAAPRTRAGRRGAARRARRQGRGADRRLDGRPHRARAGAGPARLVGALVLVGVTLPGQDWSRGGSGIRRAEDEAVARGDLDAATEHNLRMWVDGPGRTAADVDPAVREAVRAMQRRAFDLQAPVWNELDEDRLVPEVASRLAEVTAFRRSSSPARRTSPEVHATAARLAAEIPGAQSATIAGAAHVPHLERPAEFDALVLHFLAGALPK